MHSINCVAITRMDGRSSATRGVRKGAWTNEEDILLKKCIDKYGEGKWYLVPSIAGNLIIFALSFRIPEFYLTISLNSSHLVPTGFVTR